MGIITSHIQPQGWFNHKTGPPPWLPQNGPTTRSTNWGEVAANDYEGKDRWDASASASRGSEPPGGRSSCAGDQRLRMVVVMID